MKNKKINRLCILGFVLSFFLSLLGMIICIIALNNIDYEEEKGKCFAIIGIVISIIKMAAIVLLGIATIIFAISSNSFDNENDAMCEKTTNCIYDEKTGLNTCTYIDSDNIEHYITCDVDIDYDYSSYGSETFDDFE